jgi:CheY-like chemotaxis protein
MEAVGQLTGGIAHDFNNMLAAILGNLELLGDHLEGNASARRSLDIAARAASRAAELTHQLLAFSRQQHLAPQVIDLREALRGIHGLLQTTLTETVELEMQVSEDLRPVWVDPAQLESAILNLAINARDAMPAGGRLVVESTNVDLDEDYAAEHIDVVPGSYVMLAVSDNGLGMPPDVKERVFEPFFTTKEVGEGTGLGLSMIFGFIKQLGGHLTLYSEEGHGTCVKLYLPVAKASETDFSETAASRRECPGGAETVLVVEDDADVRETALVLLEDLGYRVLMAENGPAALTLLEDHRDVDLLFTDVVMPGGMSGLDLAREVSGRIPELKVLCTSGYSEKALVKDGNVPRGIEWLSKPYFHKELATKIRQVLDQPQA